MSRIMFVPVCENCGHEFTELEFYIGMELYCPKCGIILDNVVVARPDTMIHMGDKYTGYVLKYSREDYY